jgi:hypothetical protein
MLSIADSRVLSHHPAILLHTFSLVDRNFVKLAITGVQIPFTGENDKPFRFTTGFTPAQL